MYSFELNRKGYRKRGEFYGINIVVGNTIKFQGEMPYGEYI